MHIDASVYPDLDQPPTDLRSPEERADYLQRLCAAWDFHIHPDPATFALLATWKDVFDRYPLATSPAYHALRAWFGWEPVATPPELPAPRPLYQVLDESEGRSADPCEGRV
jgi:hypothetical protein